VKTDIFLTEEQREMVVKFPHLLPKDIADAVLYTLSSPPHVQIHEITIKPTGEIF
jgi:NADP-dependent 3-hydroxy acid dehydrogenase YdfG